MLSVDGMRKAGINPQIAARKVNVSRVVALSGELDLARREELLALFRSVETAQSITLDLTDVTFLDASALGCFVHLRNSMRHRSDVIRLVGVRPHIARLLALVRFDTLFEIVQVPAEAGATLLRDRTLRLCQAS